MFDDGRPPRDCPDGSHSPTFVTKAGDDQSFTAAEGAHLGVTAALASSPPLRPGHANGCGPKNLANPHTNVLGGIHLGSW